MIGALFLSAQMSSVNSFLKRPLEKFTLKRREK